MQPDIAGVRVSIVPLFFLSCLVLMLWEGVINVRPELGFLWGKPSEIAVFLPTLVSRASTGYAFIWTASAAYVGLLVGTLVGTFLALTSSVSPVVSSVIQPYLRVAASLPLLALAPLFTFWCGIDWPAKVAISAFSCVFIAFEQAMHGAIQARGMLPYSLQRAKKIEVVSLIRLVLLPGARGQIKRGLRLNISAALTAVIMGEFIASEQGLGHLLLQSLGVYRLSEAWVVLILIVLAHRVVGFLAEARWGK